MRDFAVDYGGVMHFIPWSADLPVFCPGICCFCHAHLIHLVGAEATLFGFYDCIVCLHTRVEVIKAVFLRPLFEVVFTAAVPLEHAQAADPYLFPILQGLPVLRHVAGIKVVLLLNTAHDTRDGFVVVPRCFQAFVNHTLVPVCVSGSCLFAFIVSEALKNLPCLLRVAIKQCPECSAELSALLDHGVDGICDVLPKGYECLVVGHLLEQFREPANDG